MAVKEGWGELLNARKWHYFREGRSLCGKWAYFGTDLKPDREHQKPLDIADYECQACWLRRARERRRP